MESANTSDFLVQLSESVFLVEAPNRSRFPHCNGFLFVGSPTVLLDTGMGVERLKALDARRRIDVLIISHSHPDHMLAWHVLRDRTLLLPRETPEAVEDLYRLGCRFSSTPERAAHWARRVGKGFGLRALREPDARFGGGERLDFGFAQLEAVHTPGHLEDHYCFYEHDSGLLLTTDIDFSAFGPWYGNPESDILRFRQSVKQVMRREYRMVCSSHKRPVSGDASADFADFLEGFERQRRQVLELCHPPRSLTEMTSLSPFYRNRAPDRIVQEMFEETMILKNLELLIQDGLVAKVDGRYRRR